MALDVYVGPLSRYLAGDWQTIVDDEEIGEDSNLESPTLSSRIAGSIQKFASGRQCSRIRADISRELKKAGLPPDLWPDEPSHPYQSDRLGWEGLSGIIGGYTYALSPHLPMPTEVPDISDLLADPALANLPEGTGPNHLLSEMWIPGDFDASISLRFSAARTINVSSLGALSRELAAVGQALGFAPDSWRGAVVDQPDDESTLEEAAHYGFVLLSRLTTFGIQSHVPMLLDY
jgi:hypothetical protein